MNEKSNTINLASRTTTQIRAIRASRVALMHREGEREAGRITIVFDDGPHHYRMGLVRRADDGRFKGTCEKIVRESEKVIHSMPIRCLLLDSLESDALILGLSPWVDDSQVELDWMGRFENVQRVICHEQE